MLFDRNCNTTYRKTNVNWQPPTTNWGTEPKCLTNKCHNSHKAFKKIIAQMKHCQQTTKKIKNNIPIHRCSKKPKTKRKKTNHHPSMHKRQNSPKINHQPSIYEQQTTQEIKQPPHPAMHKTSQMKWPYDQHALTTSKKHVNWQLATQHCRRIKNQRPHENKNMLT